jgi:hypothetical protein
MSFLPRFRAKTTVLLATALAAAASTSALADPPTHTVEELREMRQAIESRHEQKTQEIQNGLAGQSYDSDTALMLKMRADQEYKARMDSLRAEEQAAYNALGAKPARPGDSSARAPSAALPRFESQSVISYPQGDGAPPAEEKPHREGEQKNVGFGTRELSF